MATSALRAGSLGPVEQPRYLQLARLLRADIDRGTLQLGDRLPGERQMCTRFSVSRTTVRRALEELQAQGYVQPDGTRGWFVTALTEPNTLLGFSDLARRRGLVCTSRVLRCVLRAPTPTEAESLHAPPSGQVLELERVRLMGGSPVGWQRTVAAAWLAPNLVDHDYTNESLYAALRHHGVVPAWTDYDIHAGSASKRQAKLLEVEPGSAVLDIAATTSDQAGRRVEISESIFPGQRYRFTATVAASSRPTDPVTP